MSKSIIRIPTVSVIIPTLNSAKTLADTLDSIYDQSHPPTEVILVDGYSTDRSREIFLRYKRDCDRLITAPRCGPYAAMNIGIDASSGEIVSILNSDDYWLSCDLLSRIVNIFSECGESLGFVHGDLQTIDSYHNCNSIVKPSRGLASYFGLGLPFCHPSTFIRRSCYLQYGVYNWISFPSQADRDYGFRLRKLRIKSLYIEEPFTAFRIGGLSSTSYSYHETIRVINTFPSPRKLLARSLGSILFFHPAYYSGYTNLTLLAFSRHLLTRLIRSFPMNLNHS